MKAYAPPLGGRKDYDGLLLDFNERTIPLNPKVTEALVNYFQNEKPNIYPEYEDLTAKIAEYSKVFSDQVMLTNGSDPGIDLVFRCFTGVGDEVIIPTPSFAIFFQCAQVMNNKILTPEYNKNDLSFPTEKIIGLISPKTNLIVLCNPNNPTGTVIPQPEIKEILDKALENKAIVLVDEAYFEFLQQSAAKFINDYPNLIITRTFSKAFGLAALRIGYLISQKQNIDNMLKVRIPYDINMPAVIAASASLDNISDIENYIAEVMYSAKPKLEDFFQKKGIKYVKSGANYILFQPPIKDLDKILEEKGFRVRIQNKPLIDGFLRVTIGTAAQTQKFLDFLETLI
ncbi:pyridoxal phosphate-dependent aminotransferase [Candidatus Margulisiibacteriota bacterium]